MKYLFLFLFLSLGLCGLGNNNQKNVLVILTHPDFEQSISNKTIAAGYDESVKIRNLYKLYPDFKIDVPAEQAALKKADLIILQFPLYWHSAPAMMKKWLDEVFTAKFVLGTVSQLQGKKLLIVTTAGGTKAEYRHGGELGYTLDELFLPFELVCKMSKIDYQTPFASFNVANPVILDFSLEQKEKDRRKLYLQNQVKLLNKKIEDILKD